MIWYDMIYNMIYMIFDIWYDMMYLTTIGLSPGGSSTVHIYTQTIHRTTQSTQAIHRTTQFTNQEECGACPVFARYTLAFALQLRKKQGKTSVRVVGECQLAQRMPDCQSDSGFPSPIIPSAVHTFTHMFLLSEEQTAEAANLSSNNLFERKVFLFSML